MSKSNQLVSILTAGSVGMHLTLSVTDPHAFSLLAFRVSVRLNMWSESRKSLLNSWCHSDELCEFSLVLIRTSNERFSRYAGGRHKKMTLEHSTPLRFNNHSPG